MYDICVSCEKKREINHSTHRNGEDLKLCDECWDAALQVQRLLQVDNKAEAAKKRYQTKIDLGPFRR